MFRIFFVSAISVAPVALSGWSQSPFIEISTTEIRPIHVFWGEFRGQIPGIIPLTMTLRSHWLPCPDRLSHARETDTSSYPKTSEPISEIKCHGKYMSDSEHDIEIPDVPELDWSSAGNPPGTLRDDHGQKTHLKVYGFDKDSFESDSVDAVADINTYCDRWDVVWLQVTGLESDVLGAIGRALEIPPLILEDIQSSSQRSKTEVRGHALFGVFQSTHWDKDTVEFNQISLWYRDNLVVTFSETRPEPYKTVQQHIEHEQGQVRYQGADFLAYSIIDAIIDSYYPALQKLGRTIDELDEEVFDLSDKKIISDIHVVKRNLSLLRHHIWPQAEVIKSLRTSSDTLLSEKTRRHLHDCFEHASQLNDISHSYKDAAQGLMDFYLSMSSHRMNEVMKFLTLVATIFIPLTFIAGVYGMNFDPEASPWNMPELNWYWGYPGVLGVMALTTICMVSYFYYKGWIGDLE